MKQPHRLVPAVSGVLIMLLSGLIYAWSVFKLPIAAEFSQVSEQSMAFTFTLAMAFFCVGGLVGGFWRGLSARAELLISAAFFLAGFLVAAAAQGMAFLYLGFGVLGGLASGLSYHAVMRTVCRWFPDQQGFLSGILLMGFGLGSFLIGKVFTALTPETVGAWRVSFRVMGVGLAVLIPLGAVAMAPPRQESSSRPGKTGAGDTPRQMLRQKAFWVFLVWAVLMTMSGLVIVGHGSGMVREIAPQAAAGTVATIVGLMSVSNAVGRVFSGKLLDTKGYRVSMAVVCGMFLLASGMIALAISTKRFWLGVAAFVAAGLAYGGVTPTNSNFASARFGPAHYDVNYPLVNLNLLAASYGSTLAGMLYDRSQSYLPSCGLIALCALVGLALTALLGRTEPKK